LPLRRDNPHAKDTRFIATAGEAYARLPAGVHEGLLLSEDGDILEGLSSNFFGVAGGGAGPGGGGGGGRGTRAPWRGAGARGPADLPESGAGRGGGLPGRGVPHQRLAGGAPRGPGGRPDGGLRKAGPPHGGPDAPLSRAHREGGRERIRLSAGAMLPQTS